MGDGVDVEALAHLRPGMPAAALRAALGPRWVAPAPHQEGRVDAVARSHGFRARITSSGVLGEVVFGAGSSHAPAVDGLRMGMTVQEIQRARPDLALPPEQDHRRTLSLDLGGGLRWVVTITMETLNGMAFDDPAAVDPEKRPFAFPAPSGQPGAPFPDPNLKIAVLSSLLAERLIDLDTPEALIAHLEGRPFDEDEDPYVFNAKAYDYLTRYPLTADLLARMTSLDLGPGAAHFFASPQWDGEGDDFDVTRLDGIAACPGLRALDCTSMLKGVDLRAMQPLRRLEELRLPERCSPIEALLDLPALKSCTIWGDGAFAEAASPGSPLRRTLDALKDRGIRVRVQWISHSSADGPAPPPFT